MPIDVYDAIFSAWNAKFRGRYKKIVVESLRPEKRGKPRGPLYLMRIRAQAETVTPLGFWWAKKIKNRSALEHGSRTGHMIIPLKNGGPKETKDAILKGSSD
eukprot:TRINITY_DN37870_c0_g1_i1.p2 TRINITY_DN37870_c0_g1~~TRINITY_DN37870_c0_g1_i1.p2  ORF type:complete len:102 (-),score=19.05 TRINITY_DN37870_c0_g1_i1:732-1037(-)